MTDRQLNELISHLLDTTKEERLSSHGGWARSFDSAMAQWADRHPGTRPPAFVKAPSAPPCFRGQVPPIYEGDLE